MEKVLILLCFLFCIFLTAYILMLVSKTTRSIFKSFYRIYIDLTLIRVINLEISLYRYTGSRAITSSPVKSRTRLVCNSNTLQRLDQLPNHIVSIMLRTLIFFEAYVMRIATISRYHSVNFGKYLVRKTNTI